MQRLYRFLFVTAILANGAADSQSQDVPLPSVLDDGWKIQRIASEPDLVTPVSCHFDSRGRLLVVESHTHFPADDYEGPKTDRIYRFDDSNHDGTLDRQQLFYQGGVATMGLASLAEDWIAVATRSEVVKIRDGDADGVAEQRQVLLELDTEATYPHNGLAGVTLGSDGWLYVGQGENLGEPYTLIAADGSKQVGGGEGGNIFRLRPDGSDLERVATGFWNPFGMCFDSAGRLWAVGNDPDAMPPCRLLHVISGGDYGFQFRFGRAGTHPLQSWNGEFPGTLPMVSGTGEAPCAIVQHGRSLWVTSWGSNRIERYQLEPAGASWSAKMEVIVQGGPHFRPVGLAVAEDGSIYVTDWVDRSYPVHGKGRLWRLSRSNAKDAEVDRSRVLPALTPQESHANRLLRDTSVSPAERIAALDDQDPFTRQSAATGLVALRQLESVSQEAAKSPRQKVGLLTAWRWKELSDPDSVSQQQQLRWISWGLRDSSADVVMAAIRWAAERHSVDQLPAITGLLERKELAPALFAAATAAIVHLETGSAASDQRDSAREKLVHAIASDRDRSPRLRALAIEMLSATAERPTTVELGEWIREESDRRFGGQIVRLLAERASPSAMQLVATIVADESMNLQVRADAIGALARHASEFSPLLNKSSIPRQPDVIRREAKRVLKRVRTQGSTQYPPAHDLVAWNKLTNQGGDPQSGRRVFFRTTCANCHAHSGRGSNVGPDLTNLVGQMTRARLVESILQPSREVGPLFVTWKVLTVDGRVLTGMKLDAAGVGRVARFLGAEGGVFEVSLKDIETQSPVAASIMPAGLEQTMSIDEFRDLIAFLENPEW